MRRFLGDTSVLLSMPGQEFNPFESDAEDPEKDSEKTIRAVLFQSFGEKYKYRNRKGVNQAWILTGQSEQTMLRFTMFALLIGLIIAIEPIMDMFITMSNTTGDVTAALVVAKSEKLVNEEVYRS